MERAGPWELVGRFESTVVQDTEPDRRTGQIWLDTSLAEPLLKVFEGADWAQVGQRKPPVNTGGTAPANPEDGDLWLDPTGTVPELKVWNGTIWVSTTPAPAPTTSGAVVGSIIMYPNYGAPPGYLICNGQTVDANLYPVLRGIVGANVPDLRDQFIRGASSSNDAQGKTKHQGTTRMPRSRFTTAGQSGGVPDIAVGNVGGFQNAVTNQGAINAMSSANNGWVGTYEARLPGNKVFWAPPAHTHTINGGDSETAPDHVRLCFCIKHD